ncbi:hypothetical protein AG4045_002500 [Apium graveolens]|uniref:Pentacotripeptide-repeat region of PRORP domain-containing protein n=1 Tax=Apium graveolens TaxID=4045 RepID=A0A6L5B9H0_APIGR|nr:hypothetical protein AG4045_002498 [Apium graveolens]KAF1001489.1 hypothetical protein AG4045_002500 [Apium graveolens]
MPGFLNLLEMNLRLSLGFRSFLFPCRVSVVPYFGHLTFMKTNIPCPSMTPKVSEAFDMDMVDSCYSALDKSTYEYLNNCDRDTVEISFELYNDDICTFCREGDVDDAMNVLSEMEALGFRPNYITYSCLVAALASHGRTCEAEAIFQEMLQNGFKPRLKLCNLLLRSFLRKGLLGLAYRLLLAMDDFNLKKNRETYEILLDYYVSAGRLEDTWSVIAMMKREGFQLDSFVCSKVIGLYRDNGMWKKALGTVREIREMGLLPDKRYTIVLLIH